MAATLLQFWNDELTTYQAEQSAANDDLKAAQQALQAANAKLVTDQQALAKVVASIATARGQLATTTVPAEANALIATLTSLMIQQRRSQGTVLDDQDTVAEAQLALDAANATLSRATARVASAQGKVATATGADKKRQGYRDAIAAPPLKTLKADATAFLGSTTVTRATARLGKNFPKVLATIAGKRHDTRTGRVKSLQKDLESAQDALGTERATDGGLEGSAAQKQIAFERAQEALAFYVATALDRFGKAKGVMSKLEAIDVDTTGTVPDVLTVAEKAQVTGAAATAGAAAESTAEALDADLNAVFAAQDALYAQVLASIVADVDGLAGDAKLKGKRGDVQTAVGKFQADLAAFTAANQKDLDAWEAIIPDGAWQLFLTFEEGMATLNDLSSADPTTLATAMDNAENEYATALAAAAVAQRKVDYLGEALAVRQAGLDAAQAAITNRLLSAIRGDTY